MLAGFRPLLLVIWLCFCISVVVKLINIKLQIKWSIYWFPRNQRLNPIQIKMKRYRASYYLLVEAHLEPTWIISSSQILNIFNIQDDICISRSLKSVKPFLPHTATYSQVLGNRTQISLGAIIYPTTVSIQYFVTSKSSTDPLYFGMNERTNLTP